MPHLSAALVIEFVGDGELAGDKALRYFDLICWDGGLRLGCATVVGQVSYLSLKVISKDVGSLPRVHLAVWVSSSPATVL
jgi:hypothetical protein